MDSLVELKLEIDRAERYKLNLEKNYERKQKLGLMDEYFQRTHQIDMREIIDKISRLKRKYRMIESEEIRRKNIN
ncbi:MAG: hypothetical protein PHQ98_01685 [Candidatus ainarchaeum sp.]|nr:hypothetical protein [Candidatus ainarchaeum sp.]